MRRFASAMIFCDNIFILNTPSQRCALPRKYQKSTLAHLTLLLGNKTLYLAPSCATMLFFLYQHYFNQIVTLSHSLSSWCWCQCWTACLTPSVRSSGMSSVIGQIILGMNYTYTCAHSKVAHLFPWVHMEDLPLFPLGGNEKAETSYLSAPAVSFMKIVYTQNGAWK